MSACVVVKKTFICVVEHEEPTLPLGTRARAKTTDVATLCRRLVHTPRAGEDDEHEMRKCLSVPATVDTNQRVAHLAAGLEAGGEASASAVSEICRTVRTLVFDAAGCSLILRALEVARTSEAQALAAGLRGLVGEAARCSSACRVLEQIVHSLGTADAAFIAEELLLHDASTLVLNANGSSIICRLIEFCSTDVSTQTLVDAVLSADVAVLCGHKFGFAVAQSILSNGSSSQRGRILSALRSDVQRFARHRFASQVFEHALAFCPEEERNSLASEVVARPGTVVALARHNFGVNIVRALMELPRMSRQVQMLLVKSSSRISRDKFGSELMRELGLGKEQPKQVLDLTRELGLAQRVEYEAAVASFAMGGA